MRHTFCGGKAPPIHIHQSLRPECIKQKTLAFYGRTLRSKLENHFLPDSLVIGKESCTGLNLVLEHFFGQIINIKGEVSTD